MGAEASAQAGRLPQSSAEGLKAQGEGAGLILVHSVAGLTRVTAPSSPNGRFAPRTTPSAKVLIEDSKTQNAICIKVHITTVIAPEV